MGFHRALKQLVAMAAIRGCSSVHGALHAHTLCIPCTCNSVWLPPGCDAHYNLHLYVTRAAERRVPILYGFWHVYRELMRQALALLLLLVY